MNSYEELLNGVPFYIIKKFSGFSILFLERSKIALVDNKMILWYTNRTYANLFEVAGGLKT